jgi:hydroxymethylglutaryl-CoA reductase
MTKTINGFSKLSKTEKIQWLTANFSTDSASSKAVLSSWQHAEESVQKVIDGFTENAIANYTLPFSIAPNFLINGKEYAVPMVIEESSVVAAASSAAKFWQERGGFHAEIVGTIKLGQVHFYWPGNPETLRSLFPDLKARLLESSRDLTANMEQRGGGILDIELIDFASVEPE